MLLVDIKHMNPRLELFKGGVNVCMLFHCYVTLLSTLVRCQFMLILVLEKKLKDPHYIELHYFNLPTVGGNCEAEIR